MKKLFVFQKKTDIEYLKQLNNGYEVLKLSKNCNELVKINIQDLTKNYLVKNKIDVVISNGLTKKWYSALKNLKIISITIDDLTRYGCITDIVIDFKKEESNQFFTGKEYSFKNNKNFGKEFEEITDIIKKLDWDSGFWGFPVAYLSCKYLTESIVYRINRFIESNKIKLVEYLCNCHDNRSVNITAINNFIFADIRLSFEKKLQEKQNILLPEEFRFALADKGDIKDLLKITKDIYLDSRYYFDKNFDKEKASIFYQNWVEKGVLGTFDDECYCLFEQRSNAPIGFCTIKYALSDVANIGLVGLSKNYRNRGLAQIMLNLVFNELINKSVKKVYVVTQGRNFSAQRLYQRLGFLTKATEIWYHKWL